MSRVITLFIFFKTTLDIEMPAMLTGARNGPIICIYVHICTYLRSAYMNAYMHIWAQKYIDARIYAYMHSYMHICAHLCIYARIYTYMLAYMHICEHIYIYIYAYMCVHMHISPNFDWRLKDSGFQTNVVTQFWHGQPTRSGHSHF